MKRKRPGGSGEFATSWATSGSASQADSSQAAQDHVNKLLTFGGCWDRFMPVAFMLPLSLEAASLAAIVMMKGLGPLTQGFSHLPDEPTTARREPIHRNHRIALGVVVRDREHLAPRGEAVRGAFDHLVRGLAVAREQHFDGVRGIMRTRRPPAARAVKENSHRCADGVLVMREATDELIPGGFGMARLPRRQLRPTVEQAVAVNQDAHQRHEKSILISEVFVHLAEGRGFNQTPNDCCRGVMQAARFGPCGHTHPPATGRKSRACASPTTDYACGVSISHPEPPSSVPDDAAESPVYSAFVTTHWSVVVSARDRNSPDSDAALETLCRTYWFPLYAFVRRRGHNPQDAQDFTQEFFARLLRKEYLNAAASEKGRFRTFLLVALKCFLANEWNRQHAQKRGGTTPVLSIDQELAESRFASEPAHNLQPDVLFDRQLGMTFLDRPISRRHDEYVA